MSAFSNLAYLSSDPFSLSNDFSFHGHFEEIGSNIKTSKDRLAPVPLSGLSKSNLQSFFQDRTNKQYLRKLGYVSYFLKESNSESLLYIFVNPRDVSNEESIEMYLQTNNITSPCVFALAKPCVEGVVSVESQKN